jgi:cell division protein FtsI (penicillin-binding protein 3)
LQLDKKDGQYKEIYNMAVGWAFEPGSTFKLPSMMVAMEDGAIDRTKQVFIGGGSIKYGFLTITDSHQVGTTGWSTPLEIFAESSNVGVSKIIYDNYKDNPLAFIDGLKDMHLADSLGIDVPGEVQPKLGNPASTSWSIGSLPSKSIGYELTITPLQLLTFYNAVANNGVMVRPKFVKEIRDAGQSIQKIDTHILASSICSDKTIALARRYQQEASQIVCFSAVWGVWWRLMSAKAKCIRQLPETSVLSCATKRTSGIWRTPHSWTITL